MVIESSITFRFPLAIGLLGNLSTCTSTKQLNSLGFISFHLYTKSNPSTCLLPRSFSPSTGALRLTQPSELDLQLPQTSAHSPSHRRVWVATQNMPQTRRISSTYRATAAQNHRSKSTSRSSASPKSMPDHRSRNSAKANNDGGSATSEADSNNATAKAKKDHPEAPDVVIGMQDERGGKGH